MNQGLYLHTGIEKIKEYNTGRLPELLKLKYNLMKADRFKFFRATTHLFYEDIPKESCLFNSPNAWLCGDMHLENLGSFKGDDRVAYFNINDFDECMLGPCLIDVHRFLASLIVSVPFLGISLSETRALCTLFVDTYFKMLGLGYIRVLEKETARGVVRKFLKQAKSRKRKDFIKDVTTRKKEKLKILIDNRHTRTLSKVEKREIKNCLEQWARDKPKPEFYEVIDSAFRVAGCSSLGLKRYIVLINGRGSSGENFLLDIKEAAPGCNTNYISAPQPVWKNEAERVVEIQKRILSDPPALLNTIKLKNKYYVLKELQPVADRIDYIQLKSKLNKLKNMIEDMASVSSWNCFRGAGRQGSAIADELIYFAKTHTNVGKELIDASFKYAKKNEAYHLSFQKGFRNLF